MAYNVSQIAVSRAIVRFLKDKEHMVSMLEVQNIKEFKRNIPTDRYDFIGNHVYYGKVNVTSPYVPVSIFVLESPHDLEKIMEQGKHKMKTFKFNKFNTSDFSNVNSSLEGNLSPKDSDADAEITDAHTSDGSNKSREHLDDGSPSLLRKRTKRVLKKSRNHRKVVEDTSTDSDLNEINLEETLEKKKVAEEKENLEQQSILNTKINPLQSSDNFRGISTATVSPIYKINHDIPGTSKESNANIDYLYQKLKKLQEENEMLKKRAIEKENRQSKEFQFRKAKKRLLSDDELEFKDANNKVIKKKCPEDNLLTDSSPEKKQPKVQNKLEKFEKWIQIVDDKIEMIYLGRNTSIQLIKWRECKKSKTISLFVKNLARALWGASKLANRFLKETDNIKKLSNRTSPRKVVTPEKVSLLEDCLRFFLIRIKPSLVKTDIESEINKIRSYLSEEVAYQLRQQKLNLKNQPEL